LADFEGNTRYAEYDNFTVASAIQKYRLVSRGTYNGTAGQYNWKNVDTNALTYERIDNKIFHHTSNTSLRMRKITPARNVAVNLLP